MLIQQFDSINADVYISLGHFLLTTGGYCRSTVMFVLQAGESREESKSKGPKSQEKQACSVVSGRQPLLWKLHPPGVSL